VNAKIRAFPIAVTLTALAACSSAPGSSDAFVGDSGAADGAPDTGVDGGAAPDSPALAAEAGADQSVAAVDAQDGSLDGGASEPVADAPALDVSRDEAPDAPKAPDAGGACNGSVCVGSNWAQWPMPNGAADVANGASHPAMLVDNGDNTVSDSVTGLMWQRTVSVTQYDRAGARNRCQELRVGGHADWRVPSVIELVSILDFDTFNSSLDAKAFPDSPTDPYGGQPVAYFGTSTLAGDTTGWLVDFGYGYVALDATERDRTVFLRCVRGAPAPANDTSTGRYDLSTPGIAVDRKTGLTWQRATPPGRRKMENAKTYCATQTTLPGKGWRLPTIKELLTLVDFAKPSKFRIDDTVFDTPTEIGDPYSVYWSMTAVVSKPPYAQYTSGIWNLYFDAGQTNDTDAAGYSFFRCVR
jgi:hypothetical protein